MPVVATAGHVDHGKSTLVQALTGRDPDRWTEEKERGLTIDLGFAWTVLPGGTEIGFVDVPGHERFIKNMLAGVDVVDAALFVVAADEGWMPQSEEHLAILDQLGVDRGLVALTRADLVDDETLEFAELEVREQLEGTTLADAAVVPVASPNGVGVDRVASALEVLVASSEQSSGRTRMWIDRSFSISGAGTVVTGTLVDGPIAAGDGLVLWPDGIEVRVRGLQAHEQSVDHIEAGNRAAVNLAGIDRHTITRGAMLGLPGQWRPTGRFLARLRTVRSYGEGLRDRGAFHLHAGSGAWSARLRLLEGSEISEAGPALVTVDSPIPLRAGDRFILRDVGRRSVVAGGIVADPHPPRSGAGLRDALTQFADADGPNEIATALLRIRGREEIAALDADSGGGTPEGSIVIGQTAVAKDEAARLIEEATTLVDTFHEQFPLRPGMPKPDMASRLGVEPWLLDALASASDVIEDDGATVRRRDFGGALQEAETEARDHALETLRTAGLAVPRRTELGLEAELLHALVRRGDLVEVGDLFVYPPDTLRTLVQTVNSMPDGFTVADFRDATGITRKHAVPLLEWLDGEEITRRQGNGRAVRRSPPDGPASGDAQSR